MTTVFPCVNIIMSKCIKGAPETAALFLYSFGGLEHGSAICKEAVCVKGVEAMP